MSGDQVDKTHMHSLSQGLLPSPSPSGIDESSMTSPNDVSQRVERASKTSERVSTKQYGEETSLIQQYIFEGYIRDDFPFVMMYPPYGKEHGLWSK